MANSPVTRVSISTQKLDTQAVYAALIQGINGDLGTVDSFVLGKVTMTRADLLARFQARIDAANKVKTARAALQQAVSDERASDASVAPLRASMKKYLQARYGVTAPELQRFGFTQGRPGKPTPAVKASAALKAKATRVARGTKGTQQKKVIHGTVASPAAATTAVTPSAPASTQPVNAAVAPAATAPPATHS